MAVQKAHSFHARPLPLSVLAGVVGVPAKTVVASTKPRPFELSADKRMTIKSERRHQMMKEEEKEWKKATTFKARPNTVTFKEPFRPKKQNHDRQIPKGFKLQTEERAIEWLKFDEQKRCNEALRQIMEQERLWEEAQMKKVAIEKLRQEQVHKAQPIRHYKPLKPKAEILVTVPQSPQFSHRSLRNWQN